MIPVRVLAFAKDTGRLFQAVRGESKSRLWSWVEVSPEHLRDIPDINGDILLQFPDVSQFPTEPPRGTTARLHDPADPT